MWIKREGEIACIVKVMVKYLVDFRYITVPFSCQKLSCGVQYIPVWLSWILNSFVKSLKHVRCKWASLLPCYIICMSQFIIILKNKTDVLLTYFPLRKLCMHIRPSWSCGSWIYNYLCNQCRSPPKLCVWTPFTSRFTRYNIMWYSLSVTCDRSVVFSGYSCFIHQ